MSETQKPVKSKRGRTPGATSLHQHKKRRVPTSEAAEVSNLGQTETGPVRGGGASVYAAVTPRPPLHNDDRESGVMAAAERVVVDLTNDSGVEDEGVVDLTSSIQIPTISSYINSIDMWLSPPHATAPLHFQQDYSYDRPSCMYGPVPVQLVESDEEVQEVDTSDERPPLTTHSRGTSVPVPSHTHTASTLSSSSQASSHSRTSITCPICLETVEQFEKSGRQLVTTVCGHIFCNVCVRNTITRQHACPTCRKKLTLKQYHPLFL